MNLFYCLDAVLFVIVAICIIDANVAPWLLLQYKILLVEVRKQWLLLKMRPDMWMMKWRMQRVLKQLQADKELQKLAKEHQEIVNDRDGDSNLR